MPPVLLTDRLRLDGHRADDLEPLAKLGYRLSGERVYHDRPIRLYQRLAGAGALQ